MRHQPLIVSLSLKKKSNKRKPSNDFKLLSVVKFPYESIFNSSISEMRLTLPVLTDLQDSS